ncbi:MAG: bifunctional diguanylate cyclase/phosphodiesterase [Mycobacterium sp.]
MLRTLDLVTSIANQLVQATVSTAGEVSERALAKLVEQLGVDACFLRHSDHDIGVSRLVAEWPPRPYRGRPDPLAVAPFTSPNPAVKLSANGKKPIVIQPEPIYYGYAPRMAESRFITSASMAVAPLISGDLTIGVLGFAKFRSKKWKRHEISTLEAIASLFAQLQARMGAEERLRYLADHDDLTGLPNRRALLAHLSERLTAGGRRPVPVLYIDLDRLKSINDYLGHAAGDWFIRVFAERLRESVGRPSMIGRLGGDEFVVIPGRPMSIGAAEALAHQLTAKLRERLALGGHMVTRTVSIGVAVGMPGHDDATDLLNRADEAVLAAKRAGGNQAQVASDDTSLKTLFRSNLELLVEDDIDSEALVLHYLPEVDLWGGAVVGTEALVRWQHPTRGLLLPDSFIGVAESMNLATELGQWVMRTACADFSRWRSHGVGESAVLRINVSPAQLAGRGFARSVADTIEQFGIDAGSLCLEITERAVVYDLDATRRILAELKDIGVQLAIDDFGTGSAVLSHLKSLPVDILKINSAFVRDLGRNAGDLAIIRAIAGLAEAFDLQLVAEGVETPDAALTLMRNGCHRAQGFLLSRPLPSHAMESLLSARWIPMPFLADSNALALSAI